MSAHIYGAISKPTCAMYLFHEKNSHMSMVMPPSPSPLESVKLVNETIAWKGRPRRRMAPLLVL